MKRVMSILIIAAFSIGFFGSAALTLYLSYREVRAHSRTEEFTAFLDVRVPKLMGLYGIPGVNIALVRDGQIVYTAAYGCANQNTGQKMTADMPMRVQSISKSVTAWAVLKLAEEGKLNLDDPAERYLKSWKLPDSDYPSDGITIERLLCHTAGLPLGDVFALYSPDEAMPSLKESLTHSAILFQTPGKGFSYSNVGYNMLELIIEEVTGRDFAEYMKNEILYPLGMYHSDFEWSEEALASAPLGYTLDGKPVSPYQYPERASGGLIATAEDIARFCIAGMPDFSNQRVLAPPSIEQLYFAQAENLGIYSAVFDAYGFGYYTEGLSDGIPAVSHGGQGTGWMSHFHAVPETGDAIVILTNSQRSWPFISSLLKGWARWCGFSSPGMTRILLAECFLWGLVGLTISVTLCLITDIVRKIAEGNLSFIPIQQIVVKPSRIFKTGISLSILAVLWWAFCQKYLFLTAVFPVSSTWLGVFAAAFSLTLFIESLCQK
ncbi:MAG TPA: beta-lactamase family protein [Clostridiales bacterium]|jgi:CubicO group peptidase (beta-lactamase class C family)|nr:beta-lactamase family protein [Clostridiales bacterium]